MASYPSPRTPTSPQVQTPSTPGRRRVRFDADAPNPSIRFIPPTPLSPVINDTVEDFSNEPALFDTPTAMHSSTRPGWPTRRPSVPTTPLAYEESDPFNRYALDNDYDGYEVDMRPIVISPPAYEHVWKDIYMANSAAYRLRTALLESKRVDDVLAITKSYPQAIAARFLLHEHIAVTANAVNGAGLFPPAPGTTISSSTVPATPALTAASVSTPGSVFTSLPGTTDPDFPTMALKSAHAHLKEAFLLYSEQFDLRKEYFGRALVLEYRERGGSRSGYSSRDDSRERPERGFSGGFVMPPGPHTPGGYGYDEARNNYGYPKPGDFVRPGLGHRDSAASSKTTGNEVMLVTNGDNAEDEAMLNEDSLLCLVEDVDAACDALGDYAEMCKMLQLQVKELLKFLISHDEMVWPPPPGSVHSLGEAIIRNILVRLSRIQPSDGVGRISDSIDQLSANLVEFARGQGFEIYNGVSPSPVDPVPPMRELDNSSPKPPPPVAPPYSNPNSTSGFTDRERSYVPASERIYSNPNSTFSPPVKSASPAPTTSSSHYRPANQSPGPYVNPNRLNDMTGSQSPYSGASSQGATPSMGSMPLVRRTDPVELLSDPNGLEELASRGLDAVDAFMQVLRQDIATGHPESPRFREALVYLWRVTGHYPAERDITNEIARVGKTPVGQDAVSFTHTATWLGLQPVTIRYLRAVESPSRIRKRIRREIDTWRTLFHPNVHMFISCVMPRHGAFGLVMPIAGRGNVIQYLLANPGADRTEIVLQAAEGLRYLHEEAKLVHGDFRGVNLLVSDDERVMVTGYGILTAIERNQELGFPEWGLHWGDGRWMAPELHHYLNPKTKFPGQRTTQSDVYAFACTALEVWTSAAPFAGQSDSNVVLEVANKGRILPRPTNTVFISKSRSDQVWGLLQACWNLNPGVRPNMRTVVENLRALAE
ncbi:unnamed protein product [Rhizoctonia solani]|uniref:Protein kinase domain-containing protein n=1 Tax=Rhizoctonia solani TaxID=456999 RepID=A0A8H3C4J4_9AGAM|nr:unnamed protein product [Rhizoctonia solani]